MKPRRQKSKHSTSWTKYQFLPRENYTKQLCAAKSATSRWMTLDEDETKGGDSKDISSSIFLFSAKRILRGPLRFFKVPFGGRFRGVRDECRDSRAKTVRTHGTAEIMIVQFLAQQGVFVSLSFRCSPQHLASLLLRKSISRQKDASVSEWILRQFILSDRDRNLAIKRK